MVSLFIFVFALAVGVALGYYVIQRDKNDD